MRKRRRNHKATKEQPKMKKGEKHLTEKQSAWKSFWDRYCQM